MLTFFRFIQVIFFLSALLLCACNEKNRTTIDDAEYPYAGLPRIAIETDSLREIKDRETKIPAKLRIFKENEAQSEILPLTIKGRGNSSWTDMPQKSYKLEFKEKQALFGMPENRDWAMVSSYGDKTLLKNYVTYKLSSWLNADYSPRGRLVEVYLNREYKGVYLFVETLKIGKERINWIDKENAFFAEFDIRQNKPEQKKKDYTFFTDGIKKPVIIHSPKKVSDSLATLLSNHLDSTTIYIRDDSLPLDSLKQIFDMKSYLQYYWVQEFSKNFDGAFASSVHFTWKPGGTIKMGPLWDFDLAYGGIKTGYAQIPFYWHTRKFYWNNSLFHNEEFVQAANSYWKEHRDVFAQVPDSIHAYGKMLEKAAQNHFKRWPILEDTTAWFHPHAYSTYSAAVDSLESWVRERTRWIDKHTGR
ncbi:MAG: CotH kinase family protein [Fibrobacter sp.]|nr:CotH kinase family protein [Fibrobacter sp.]